MKELKDLSAIMRRIDGKGYKAYLDVRGAYRFSGGELFIDHVQADPFAAPSRVRLRLDQCQAGWPADLFGKRIRRTALEDFLAREMDGSIRRSPASPEGSGKSGSLEIDAGGQEVLERAAVVVTPDWVEARMEVGLPAAGRRVRGRQAEALLCGQLPALAGQALICHSARETAARTFILCVENQEAIRQQLKDKKLIAFIANGSILPRGSGVSDRPMAAERALAFRSPESLRVEFQLPNPKEQEGQETRIEGMGIPEGVTLLVGGGYHGKSTLLRAIERGVYPHIPGDGREFVVTDPDAMKIRAEDRRRVEQVCIDPFISGLPDGADTLAFRTDEASGSTSQAAAIVEAIEAGAKTLLMDEDTCASNLMVRDAQMQALVCRDREPITPFVDRVRELYDRFGISTVLVMGGSGDYFSEADVVIQLDGYRPYDVTQHAKEIARHRASHRRRETHANRKWKARHRRIDPSSVDPSKGGRPVKIDVAGLEILRFGRETVALGALDQLVDPSQTRAIGYALWRAVSNMEPQGWTVRETLDWLESFMDREGVEGLSPFIKPASVQGERAHPGRLARPRRHEIVAALNRLRTWRVFDAQPAEIG